MFDETTIKKLIAKITGITTYYQYSPRTHEWRVVGYKCLKCQQFYIKKNSVLANGHKCVKRSKKINNQEEKLCL